MHQQDKAGIGTPVAQSQFVAPTFDKHNECAWNYTHYIYKNSSSTSFAHLCVVPNLYNFLFSMRWNLKSAAVFQIMEVNEVRRREKHFHTIIRMVLMAIYSFEGKLQLLRELIFTEILLFKECLIHEHIISDSLEISFDSKEQFIGSLE